jgi:hypothetical protein
MPRSKPRKRNGKPVRYRSISPALMTAYAAGQRFIPSQRCISQNAIWDVIKGASKSELSYLCIADKRQWLAWLDTWAESHPDDIRWNDYRSRRTYELGQAS